MSEKTPAADESVKLSVNLAPDVAADFRRCMNRRGYTVTAAVARALVMWVFIEDCIYDGKKILTYRPRKNEYREIEFL